MVEIPLETVRLLAGGPKQSSNKKIVRQNPHHAFHHHERSTMTGDMIYFLSKMKEEGDAGWRGHAPER